MQPQSDTPVARSPKSSNVHNSTFVSPSSQQPININAEGYSVSNLRFGTDVKSWNVFNMTRHNDTLGELCCLCENCIHYRFYNKIH